MTARCAVALHPEDDLRTALLPLFTEGHVDAVEWTWEAGVPEWLDALVAFYASNHALYTHLVGFPLFGDGASLPRRLAEIARRSRQHRPRHVTAHYGLVQAEGFSDIAPLPPVPCAEVVSTGRERLLRLADAAECAVGVENLAFAFSLDDVARQGDLVDSMLPDQGFLLLDLHNIHCQAITFERSPEELLARYPLEKVREIHLSGGRTTYPKVDPRPFRRDTHDDAVPAEVLALLDVALARCPAVEVVCLERLGGTLATKEAQEGLVRDFRAMRERVAEPSLDLRARAYLPLDIALPSVPARVLRDFERKLVTVLRAAPSVEHAKSALRDLAHEPTLAAFVARMEPRAIEVAMEIEKRWAVPALDSRAIADDE